MARNWEQESLRLAWWDRGMNHSLSETHLIQEYRWALEEVGVSFCQFADFNWDYRVYFMDPTLWVTGRGEPQKDIIFHTSCPVDKVPEAWVDVLNRAGLVWVPSEWNKKVFAQSGIERPIMVGGYGVACDEEFGFVEQNFDGPYTFLVVSGFIKDQGNCMDVIKAFVTLDLPDARLIVKTERGPWKKVNVTKGGKEFDVRIITEPYSQWEMAELLGKVNCLVCPSSGETFGLTALQAMSMGRAVMVTDWGVLGELATNGHCLPISVKGLVEADLFNHRHEGNGRWAEIDLESLVNQMLYVYENREAAAEMGQRASAYVQENYSWPVVAEGVKETLQNTFDGGL